MAKTEQSSSRMDTVLKMLLIAFVSLLAFSSGVYFGKQMSDSDHQLKALESDFNTSTAVAAATNTEGTTGEEQMGDEEVAALSEKYMNAEKDGAKREVASEHEATPEHAAATTTATATKGHEETGAEAHTAPAKAAAHAEEHAEAHAAPAAAVAPKAHEAHGAEHASAAPATAGKPDLSAAHRAAERVANNASPISNKPEVEKHESRVPSSLPKTVGTNGSVEFTVQVASYPTADAAKSYANGLVKKGFPAFPVEATINGKTWYRVSVGSFKTMKDATTYRAQLLKQADLQNAIVQKITR
jgi:cell division protein FtsN